jgi:nucleolar protein 56
LARTTRQTVTMAGVNYLLYESAVGYAIFEVVYQADSVGLSLQEVRDSMKELSRFGKMVKLVNFTPWQYVAAELWRSVAMRDLSC